MLTETLRKFHRSQSGSPVFSLPSGKRVDLRDKHSRQALARWIVEQFDGDLDAADEAVSSVMARALREARAPWPYLLSALRGIAEVAETREPLSRKCQNSILVSRLSRAHFDVLTSTICEAGQPLTISGREWQPGDDSEYSLAMQDLLGDDPFPLYVATSPQFSKRVSARFLIDDVIQYRAIALSSSERNEAQATFLGFLGQAIVQCKLSNEFNACLKAIKSFYSRFFHPAVLGVRFPGVSVIRSLADAVHREYCLALFRRHEENELYRADWLRQALNLGIIASPITWLVFIMLRHVDTSEEWRDINWYSTPAMCEEYGHKRVTELFPELVTV